MNSPIILKTRLKTTWETWDTPANRSTKISLGICHSSSDRFMYTKEPIMAILIKDLASSTRERLEKILPKPLIGFSRPGLKLSFSVEK